MEAGQEMYSLPYETSNPRPDLHSLVFNVKFRQEMYVYGRLFKISEVMA